MSLRSLLTNLIHLCWIQLFVCSVLLKGLPYINTTTEAQARRSTHGDPFPLRTKHCSAPHKWKLTPSPRAHLLRDTTRKPRVSAENATLLIWIRSFTFCQMLLGNLIYRRGDRKYEQSSALAWFNEALEMGFVCVCFRSRFQKGFQFSRVGTELSGCAGISE